MFFSQPVMISWSKNCQPADLTSESCSSTKCFFTTPSVKKYMRSSGPGSFHQVWGGKWKIHPKVFWKKPSHHPSSLRKLLLFPNPIYIFFFTRHFGVIFPLQSPPFTKEIPIKKGGWTQTKIHGHKVCLIFFKTQKQQGRPRSLCSTATHHLQAQCLIQKLSKCIS